MTRYTAGFFSRSAGIFWERLEPEEATSKPPLVMIHGGAHSGACYLTTPDGRPGWAHRAVERGFPVILPDWPGCGRSGYVPWTELNGERVCRALGAWLEEETKPLVLMTHSMSGPYGWKLVEQLGESVRAVIGVAPGPPGNIQAVPRVFRRTEDVVEIQGVARRRTIRLKEPGAPDDEFVFDKLLGESTRFPRAHAEAYRLSLQRTPPRLGFERQNVDGSQLRVEDESGFRDKPVLVITGSHDTDHPREVDGAIVQWLNRMGARAEFDFLADAGIVGNGHMLMLEDNSDIICDRILDWLEARLRV